MTGKIVDMDTGLSLRLLMAERNVQGTTMAHTLGVSSTTISALRRERFMSGSNMAMLCIYFGISASDFIRKGETNSSGE